MSDQVRNNGGTPRTEKGGCCCDGREKELEREVCWWNLARKGFAQNKQTPSFTSFPRLLVPLLPPSSFVSLPEARAFFFFFFFPLSHISHFWQIISGDFSILNDIARRANYLGNYPHVNFTMDGSVPLIKWCLIGFAFRSLASFFRSVLVWHK